MEERKLIINADDFGLTRGVNLAVADCLEYGVLRSATLMANGEAFADAVATAQEHPNLGVGIHFVLTGLAPLTAPEKIPELLGGEGRLPAGLGVLMRQVLTGKNTRSEIRKELFAQAEKVFDSGIVPTHFDCHKHVHLIPAVLDAVIEIAQRYSVKWIRTPFENRTALSFISGIEKDKKSIFLKQFGVAAASRSVGPFFQSRVRRSGIRTPDCFYGIAATGLMNEEVIRLICRKLKPGVSELMTHPGYVDKDLMSVKTRLLESRDMERNLLVSENVKDILVQNRVILSHFGEVD